MALKTKFLKKLHDLWQRRVTFIQSVVGLSVQGRPRVLNKKVRERRIIQLLDTATGMLRRRATKELRKIIRGSRQRHIKGRGIRNRFNLVYEWARQNIKGPIIYSFWRGKRCLYLGKGRSRSRLKNYSHSIYLKDADLLEVNMVRGGSLLPKAECLAVHLFEPRDNRVKPAKEKWGKACLICKAHDEIRGELRRIFAL